MSNSLLELIDKELVSKLSLPKKNEPIINAEMQSLLEMVDKEIGKLSLLVEKEGGKKLDITAAWQSIPLPTLSEMGWADPSKKGGKIASATRSEMSQYLANITKGGTTLEARIQLIEDFMKTAFAGSVDMSFSETLSFLVFYKTLTYIISDFNKATAGFLFEALLGVLTGGQQIPAKGAGGGDTIADFKYKTGAKGKGTLRYVSLKLLTEGGTTIDGSFTDLINDLAEGGDMQYVVVLKELTGKGEKTEGSLKFYEFIFNRDSLIPFLEQSTAGQAALQIADSLGRKLLDRGVEAQTKIRWLEWLETFGQQALVGGETQAADFKTSRKKDATRISLNDAMAQDVSLGLGEDDIHNMDMYEKYHPDDIKRLQRDKEKTQKMIERGLPFNTFKWLATAWNDYNINADKESVAAKNVIKRVSFMNAKNSMAFLQSIDDEEKFWETILKYSNGILNRKRFVITQDNMKSATGTTEIGELSVGRTKIHEMLGKVITDYNEQMFQIFRSMEDLSTTLREFFMEEMDATKGKAAKKAASQVHQETEELITNRGTLRKSSKKGS